MRERGNKRRDDALLHRDLLTRRIYQLDWPTLLVGVLPLRIRELTEGAGDAVMKFVIGPLHPVAGATRIGATETFDGRYV